MEWWSGVGPHGKRLFRARGRKETSHLPPFTFHLSRPSPLQSLPAESLCVRFLPVDTHLLERRNRIANALDLKSELLLIGAGQPVALPENTDQTYPFRSHAEYFYLTENDSSHGVLAFDPKDGAEGWVSFVPEVTDAERTWEGREQAEGTPIAALEPWLTNRRGRPLVLFGEPLRRVVAAPAPVWAIPGKFPAAPPAKEAVQNR